MKQIKAAYTPRERKQITCGGGRTKTDQQDMCDINKIMGKYRQTALVSHVAKYQGNYGDFDSIDYHEAMTFLRDTEEMFMSLPADIRGKFDNDPAAFMDFTADPENAAEMRKMGLLKPETPGAPAAPDEPGTRSNEETTTETDS